MDNFCDVIDSEKEQSSTEGGALGYTVFLTVCGGVLVCYSNFESSLF